MVKLNLPLQLTAPDEIYRALIALIDDVGDEVGLETMAALVLTLANQIGDDETVLEAIDFVRGTYAEAPVHAQKSPALITDTLTNFFGAAMTKR